MTKWQHKRGNRAVGWCITQGFLGRVMGNKAIIVQGDGTFETPGKDFYKDDPKTVPEALRMTADQKYKLVYASLKDAGHIPFKKVPKKLPEIKPIKAKPDKTAVKPKWYPMELTQIKGIGSSTAKRIGKQFPAPVDILNQEKLGTHPGGPIGKCWPKIVDFIKSKLED